MSNTSFKIPCYTDIKKWCSVPKDKWDSWQWQLQNTVRSAKELRNILDPIPMLWTEEIKSVSHITQDFEMKLTPHIVLNIHRAIKLKDYSGVKALLATFVPTSYEITDSDENVDAIGEELECSKPAPLITNFYKTRVLLFATNTCASYCRFCFRRRKLGDHVSGKIERGTNKDELHKAIDYIKRNKSIREVIISGGDPLILSNESLFLLLQQLKKIAHIKILRINTKTLTVFPQRITQELVDVLKKFQPIYIIGNFLHPIELTPETLSATSLLIDAGILVFSHTALLRSINESPEIISNLMWSLYVNRIIPYYLIHFIPTKWTEHFRVPIQRGLEITKHLHGHLSGIANPIYIAYLPDGGGKVPLSSNYLIERTGQGYYFENWEGKKVLIKEPIDL